MAALVLQGCGSDGGGDDVADRSTTSSRPTHTNVVSDHAPVLVSPEDLGFVADDLLVADEGDAGDQHLRMPCGRDVEPPAAGAATFREVRNREGTLSVTTSVHVFRGDERARQAFGAAERAAESCATSTFTSEDGTFVATVNPTIQNAGDQAFSFFSREADTGRVVADHVVRRNEYVLDVHFDVSPTADVDEGALATIATEANREFASWADDR